MLEPSVLIITTGHDLQDGRLVRHQRSLAREGITVDIKKVVTNSRRSRFIYGPLGAYRLIRKSSANCVILPDPELQLFLPPLLHKKLAVISDVHENYEHVLFDRIWISRILVPFVKVITKIMRKVRDRWSHIVVTVDSSLALDSYFVIPNYPNLNDLPNPSESLALKRLVYVGDIRESRGLISMLNLVKEIPQVGLDLIGPCNNEDLNRLIGSMNLSDRVIWHGRKSYKESWEIASKCLAGLSLLSNTPSFENAKPTKIWEYWSVGIPVLASDLPGQREMVLAADGGKVGSFVDLKKALISWVENPNLAKATGARGREYLQGMIAEKKDILPELINESILRFHE